MALESSGVAITSDSVKTKLLQDVRSTETNALYVNKNKGNRSQSAKQASEKTSTGKGPRCFVCNKYGHISKNCRNKKSKEKSEQSTNYVAVFSATTCNEKGWYIDSGASMHMTMNSDWLYVKIPPPISTIKVANDEKLLVEACGKINLNVADSNGKINTIQVQNVLYVPGLATDLLSVTQMIKNGCHIQFNEKGCKILNRNKEQVSTAKMINNMYRLNTHSTPAYTSASKDNDYSELQSETSDESFKSDEGSIYEPDQTIDPTELTQNVTTRSKQRTCNMDAKTYSCVNEVSEQDDVPQSYTAAMSSHNVNAKHWKQSIQDELKAHEENNTWNLIEKPEGVRLFDFDPHTTPEKATEAPDKTIPYREAVGSLMHLAVVSRPDIMYGVSLVRRYLNCYDQTHWNVIKKILRYLKGTKDYGLCYTPSKSNLEEKYSEKQIDLKYVNTKEQYADIFTKALPKEQLQYLRNKIGVKQASLK
ncbi:unnamed protein product [Arctia plantaginis]|uniref:CCHC-type domain-containing protein n=1 Tax=Arctia plantaginis TaxID=874455 RepID=A0A8S1AA79_ARCPL|nr:unnamed protein product [Arctia plantaginis]